MKIDFDPLNKDFTEKMRIRDHPFSSYAKFSEKLNISYQDVRNVALPKISRMY